MEAPFATTFTEYVAWMASNSPHATMLDWWRRLELALREYANSRDLPPRARHDRLEDAVSEDPYLGPEIAAKLRCLRQRRNTAAHGPHRHVSRDEAVRYAERALELIGIFGKLSHESRPKCRLTVCSEQQPGDNEPPQLKPGS